MAAMKRQQRRVLFEPVSVRNAQKMLSKFDNTKLYATIANALGMAIKSQNQYEKLVETNPSLPTVIKSLLDREASKDYKQILFEDYLSTYCEEDYNDDFDDDDENSNWASKYADPEDDDTPEEIINDKAETDSLSTDSPQQSLENNSKNSSEMENVTTKDNESDNEQILQKNSNPQAEQDQHQESDLDGDTGNGDSSEPLNTEGAAAGEASNCSESIALNSDTSENKSQDTETHQNSTQSVTTSESTVSDHRCNSEEITDFSDNTFCTEVCQGDVATSLKETLQDNSGSNFKEDLICEAEDQQKHEDCPTPQKKWGKKFSKEEKATRQNSSTANSNHGGITASLKKIGVDSKLLKLCREHLSQLVGDNSQNPSPRRDNQKLCERLLTYRNVTPARKEEGRPVILLLPDVSGSCASFSVKTLEVSKAAGLQGVQGADILVVAHSNGYPEETSLNGRLVALKLKASQNDQLAWYGEILTKYQVEIVIALGDWDASNVYAQLANHHQVQRLIWLDNAYASSRGTVRDDTKWALTRFSQSEAQGLKHKLTYKTGCKGSKEFIQHIK